MWLTIWRILLQLIYITVVLSVFSDLQERSEILMVALIGIIYGTIRISFIHNRIFLRDVLMALQQELNAIKSAVIPEFMINPESYKILMEAKKKANQPLWFEYSGLVVIELICFINIFDNLK